MTLEFKLLQFTHQYFELTRRLSGGVNQSQVARMVTLAYSPRGEGQAKQHNLGDCDLTFDVASYTRIQVNIHSLLGEPPGPRPLRRDADIVPKPLI